MLRQSQDRIDAKRRNVVDHRRRQFASPRHGDAKYPHRLSLYADPPTADITLEQFEQWAIDRLKVLAELEACSFRNKTAAETAAHMKPILDKYLPLDGNGSGRAGGQRQKDHYSHFILRLAFASTEDARRRFARVETMLFRLRFNAEDPAERWAFVSDLETDWWEPLTEEEKREHGADLAAMSSGGGAAEYKKASGAAEEEAWFKVDWERVPDLVEGRRALVRGGKAYVPRREQSSMVVADFSARLEKQLEATARALPKLDEDERLTPILNHLSKNFITPDSAYMSSSSSGGEGGPSGAEMTAGNVDALSRHFPACMWNLHASLRRDAHLKHYGRLQYTLFLKGMGLGLEECLVFWRSGFHRTTDDQFNREYRYNVRHAYGDVGGDSNRRGGGYGPFSCQKILTEHPPGPGEAHGCPYRHFDGENLTTLLAGMGVTDGGVVRGVMEDRSHQKYHVACNRVFEHLHKANIKKAKEDGVMTAAQLETIVHPNEYFKRSYVLSAM